MQTDRLGRDYRSDAFISADLVSDAVLARCPRIYMCGPPPMMDASARRLMDRGVPKFNIFREAFRSPTIVATDDRSRYSVTFAASSKAAAPWSSAEGPLLNFGEKLDVPLPSGCRVGQCESYAVTIISGKVATCTDRNRTIPPPA